MVIFKDNFNMKKAEAIQYKSFELLEVTTTISNQLIRFLTIYRPPPSKKNKLRFTMFKDEFQNFAIEKSLCNGNLILIGDFNIHVENENDSQGKWLIELFDSHLEQHIREPTHDAKKPKPSRKTFKYRKTKNIDIVAFKRTTVEAEVSKKVEACASVNEKIFFLSNTISNVLEAHAPQKVKSIVIRPNCEWYTDGLRKAKQERRKSERRWKKSRLEIDRQLYVPIKNKVNDMIKSSKRKYFKDKLFEAKGNCKEYTS
ncbi:hypothetical protein ElyMa_000851400 [Elysia marginata]|uniref:Endonuclease/exonuclease/phosphatase domain-containing protein n=1 Tax=Elysia marginata TaxID=1093978 RepID=A0AAV4H2Q9_9GAST|nr:hypothetical protein ElyMa_000851400 [Elysia marginata]